MKKLLLIAISLLTFANISEAQILEPIDNMKNVHFVSKAIPVTQNGVALMPSDAIGGINREFKGTIASDNYGNNFAVLSAIGVVLSVTNNGNVPAVISWKDSTINVDGKSYGVPFLGGMKYADAGNPAATPPTIIGPNQSDDILVFLPNISFINDSWNIDGVPIRPNKNIVITIYAMLNNRIATVTTPGINLVK